MIATRKTKTNRFSRARRRAFTLIELLLVLVILGILATVVATNFAGKSEKARMAAAKTDISAIDTALDGFRVDCGRYPTQEEGLQALITNPGNTKGWDGPYVKKGLPTDPWGNPYVYRFPGQQNQNGFDLFSMGADGHEGGNDDVDNWSTK